MASFTVTIEDFEGPIEALLRLIEKRKLPINDISLANLTDDYLRFIEALEHDSLSNKTHFIFVASTLILIKSKSLLPTLDLTDDEEGDIEALKNRLLVLQEYQQAGQLLKSHYQPRPAFYYSKPSKKQVSFQPHENITNNSLLKALRDVFVEIPEPKKLKKEASIKIAVHIEEMMNSLEKRIKIAMRTDFSSFVNSYIPTDKSLKPKEMNVYRVVGFLAVLELARKGILEVLQTNNFDTISIEKYEPTPTNN